MDHVPLEDADERLKKPFRDYVKQKGWGKGFTDWSLLIANANQLHFVVTHSDAHLRTLETVFLILNTYYYTGKEFHAQLRYAKKTNCSTCLIAKL